ncbi:MAG: alpha/beta hydrolase [Myxococcota bacterium]
MSTPHRTLRVDVAGGLHLAVTERNPAGAPTVVMLHGYLDQRGSLEALANALPPTWRVLTVDWRGHGDSDRVGPGGSYHLLDHVKDLDALIRALELTTPVVIGHSMGGNAAVLLAGALPERVGPLVLLETLGPPAEGGAEAPLRLGEALKHRAHLRAPKLVPDVESAISRLQQTNPGLSRPGAERMAAHALSAVPGGWRWKFDPAVQGNAPLRFSDEAMLAFLSAITVPVLLVRAAHGYVPARETSPARYHALRRLTVVQLEEVGHHVHVEQPERVAREITTWLAAQAG